MRTTFDIDNILYQVLSNNAGLTATITGSVYKRNRPVSSTEEDIVIGSLPVPNNQLQRTVANVNIHVPLLEIATENGQDTQPDTVRAEQLTDMVVLIVDDIVGPDYYYDVQQQNVFFDSITNDYYSNIRVNFFLENL